MQMMGAERGATFLGFFCFGFWVVFLLYHYRFFRKKETFPQKYFVHLHACNCKLKTCPRNILVYSFMVKKSKSTCLFLVLHMCVCIHIHMYTCIYVYILFFPHPAPHPPICVYSLKGKESKKALKH